jgi:hypothetical protein
VFETFDFNGKMSFKRQVPYLIKGANIMFPEDDSWEGNLYNELEYQIKLNAPESKRDAIKIKNIITELRKWFDREYKDIIKPKTSGKRYWFENEPSLKKPPRFLEVYLELFGNTISWSDNAGNALIEKAGGRPYFKGKDKEDVCVIPDYAAIAIKYNLSEVLIRKYVNAMVEAGILKKLPKKTGPRGRSVYAIGYWQNFRRERKEDGKIEFLPTRREFIREIKNRDQIREALKNLKL